MQVNLPDPVAGLPPPDELSLRHSRHCAAHLRERLQSAGGSLAFREFMQEALFAPGLGYYAAGATKFGRAGDFVTAPEVSPLFGAVLARACAEVLDACGGGDILEFGAGTGRLAVDVLQGLEALDRLPRTYAILEVSADLRARQAERLRHAVPELAARIRWLDRLPTAHRGVVLANEVLDALPVERFRIERGVQQLRVVARPGGFDWLAVPAPPTLEAGVREIERQIGRRLENGYTSEFSPLLAPWVGSLADCLERGAALLFDYGTTRREYYGPERGDGWLRCHFRHHAHDDPLVLPGIQDISCWVDFTAAAAAAVDAGLRIGGYVSQAQFLLAGGITEELAERLGDYRTGEPVAHGDAGQSPSDRSPTPTERVELATQVKMLTLPGEMGERFKCLGLVRDLEALPLALTAQDRTHTL